MAMVNDLIYDIGMNNGEDTAYYLHEGFRVVAVEAHPQFAAVAAKRFASAIHARRLTILNVGIAATAGKLPFWICDTHPEWSSFNRDVAARDGCPHYMITVPCQTFASVIEQFGVPYYAKIDIEGNDELCIQDLRPDGLPKYVSVEASDLDLLTLLAQSGYSRFKCISQFHFLPLEEPPTPEQQHYERFQRLLKSRSPFVRAVRVFGGRALIKRGAKRSRTRGSWTFPLGSSGPFGDQLPGRWLTRDELWAVYTNHLERKNAGLPGIFWDGKDYSFWTDFHARRDD